MRSASTHICSGVHQAPSITFASQDSGRSSCVWTLVRKELLYPGMTNAEGCREKGRDEPFILITSIFFQNDLDLMGSTNIICFHNAIGEEK